MHGPWPIPCRANMFTSCKKQVSWYFCASLVPLGMKWACISAARSNVLYSRPRVSSRDMMCRRVVDRCRCVAGCASVVWKKRDLTSMTVPTTKKNICNRT